MKNKIFEMIMTNNIYKQFLDKFDLLGDAFENPIIVLSLNYQILYINKAALSLYNWKLSNVKNEDLISLLEKNNFPLSVPLLPPVNKTDSVKPIKTVIVKPGENKRIYLWKIIQAPMGKKIRKSLFLLQGKNITYEKYLEKKVFDLDSIIAQLPGNVYWYDKKFKYLGCNENSAKTLGMSRAETIGKNLETLMNRIKDVDPKLIRHVIQDGHDVLNSGIAKLNIEEIPFVGSKGKKIITLASKVPLKNKVGKIYGVLGISTDITELKQIQSQLKTTNQKVKKIFQKIIDTLPVLLFWTDKDLKIVGNNLPHTKAFGFKKPDEMIGKSIIDFSRPIDLSAHAIDEIYQDHLEIMQTKSGKVLEYTNVLADGKKHTHLSHKEPLLNEKGESIGIIGISMDITELKETQRKLEISNAVKQDFIANMSHDMRTPITGVMGMLKDLLNLSHNAETTLDENSDLSVAAKTQWLHRLIDRIEENSNIALDSIDNLLKLCNEILEVAKLETHTRKVPLEAFDPKLVFNDTFNLLKPAAKDRGLALNFSIDKNVPQFLHGSRQYLTKSLLNLMSNAIKFTDKGSVNLNVSLLSKPKKPLKVGDKIKLKIDVIDTGIGIPRDKFDAIFDHFSRLTPTYQDKYHGSGLGLYTVKQYANAMNGKVTVDSKVGKGSIFTLILPFTVDDHSDYIPQPMTRDAIIKPKRKAQPSVGDASPRTGVAHILIVEDNQAAAFAARGTAHACHLTVDFACSGKMAVKKASENTYDLILMDLGLPDFSGMEATKKIRALKDKTKANVPIVALTGHASEEELPDLCKIGMQDLIVKPATEQQLQSVLGRFVLSKKVQASASDTFAIPEPVKQHYTDKSLVIDWPACLKRETVNGNEDALYELLSILEKEFKKTIKIFKKAFKKKDIDAFRAELHRCRGALTYLNLPELDITMKAFHDAVRAKPLNQNTLATTYQSAMNAINNFQKAYANKFQAFKK
jgi:PAS domain S-box-containing protein